MRGRKERLSVALLLSAVLVAIFGTYSVIQKDSGSYPSLEERNRSRSRKISTEVRKIGQAGSMSRQHHAEVESLPEFECEIDRLEFLGKCLYDRPQFVAENLMNMDLTHSSKCSIAIQLLRSWPDTKKSLAWAETNFNGVDRGLYLGIALGALARTSHTEALAYWENMTEGKRIRSDALSGLVDGWFLGDRGSLLNHVQRLGQSKQAEEIMDQISFPWVTSDLPGAISYLANSSGDRTLKTLARMTVAVRMNNESPIEMFAWAESLKGPAGVDAKRAAIETWAARSPQDVAAFLESVAPMDKVELESSLARKWAASDPIATTKWIDQQPDSSAKARIVSEAMEVLLTANTIHASRWLGTLPEGDTRDAGILVLLDREARNDPSGVFPWADALSNEVLREEQTNKLMGMLQRQNLEE
jgi:hypothetical protein